MKRVSLIIVLMLGLLQANAQTQTTDVFASIDRKASVENSVPTVREEVQLFGYVTIINALDWAGFKGALITLNLRDNPKESVIIFLDERHYMQTVFETGLQTTFLVTVNCTETDRPLPSGGTTGFKKYDTVRSVQLFNRR